MGTALITGASAGLGRAFAAELARRGHDLVLVARSRDRLQEVADELSREHGIRAEVLPADLADRAQVELVVERVSDPDRPVDLLVNNAGFGMGRRFTRSAVADQERALEVMVRAVLVLSHAAARAMTGRGNGAILNVSSMAGFAAMGTYSAIKSWVTVFSEALATELAGTGVTVTAVCPGFVHTEFHDRAEITMAQLPGWGWLEADRVVRDALADLAAGKVVSVPSRRYAVGATVLRHAPRGLVRRGSHAVARRRGRH